MVDYNPVPVDTTKEAAREQYQRFRQMSPAERAQVTFQLSDMMRSMAEKGVRRRHPEYDQQTVRLALIRLTAGEEVFNRFFPDREVRP